ncbi:ATP-grasp domain-containing protein [Tumebacillus algifaecis]|nr:ATP-grasp domain-containing protein [Tumebacillus algifaecis]
MSRPQAVVFIDNVLVLLLARRASYAQDLGYRTYLIAPPMLEAHTEAMAQYEQTERDGRPTYDQIFPTEHFDIDTLRTLLAEIEQEADIKGLVVGNGPFCKDGLVGAHVATLAEERGLPSQNAEALYLCGNKYLMRDSFRADGLNTIDFGLAVDEASLLTHASRIGYPVLMKPINGVASHLILKSNNEAELLGNFRLAMEKLPGSAFQDFYQGVHAFPNRQGELMHFDPMRCMLLEQYIPGREVSIEMLITEDRCIPLLVHDKVDISEDARCVYENLAIVPPVRFTQEECNALEACAVQAVQAVGLKNTVAHVELRYGENGLGPQVLEINPRMGGAYIMESLKTMVGVDHNTTHVELMTGTFQPKATYDVLPELHAMMVLYAPHGGLFQAIDGIEECQALPSVLKTMQPFPVGHIIHGDDEEVSLLLIWMKGDSAQQIAETGQKIREIVTFKIDPSDQANQPVT